MTVLKGHVMNGRIIVDDPVELPEGAEVDVYLHDRASETARREDLAALERALGRSLEQADGGELIDADEVLAELQTL